MDHSALFESLCLFRAARNDDSLYVLRGLLSPQAFLPRFHPGHLSKLQVTRPLG